MTYQVLFLDIDGTILQPDHTYSESTKDAILQLQNQGIEVFIATGRPLHEIGELAEALNVDSFIGYNGAYAVYQHKTILDEPMKREQVRQLLDIAKANHHEMILYTSEENYCTTLDDPVVQQFIETFDFSHTELFTEDAIDQVLGITVMKLTPSQPALYQIDESIRMTQVHVEGSEHAYDILRNNVNKGEAVKKVLASLQITKEQAIAFGDGMNDKEMLESVGESFAMGNAHPDLFQYAKHKTTTVTESGIFNGLKSLGLVK